MGLHRWGNTIGLMAGYRVAGDSRQDKTEGIVRVVWRLENPVYCESSSMNSRYILSTSHPETDRHLLTQRFGSYVVGINDPIELSRRIEIAWQRHPWASGRCVIAPVMYDKDSLFDPVPGLLPPREYSYSQKPKVPFEVEREFGTYSRVRLMSKNSRPWSENT